MKKKYWFYSNQIIRSQKSKIPGKFKKFNCLCVCLILIEILAQLLF